MCSDTVTTYLFKNVVSHVIQVSQYQSNVASLLSMTFGLLTTPDINK